MDGEDVEAVVEVLAQAPLFKSLLYVAVGGSDDAHINWQVLSVAHAPYFPLLDGAVDLDLQIRGKFGNLIEEQRSPVRLFEEALLVLRRPAEGAFDVPEQFALDQLLRHGAAVDGHETVLRPWARVVDGAGEQFLARAALPRQEHRGLAGGGFSGQLVDVLHRLTAADDI